MPSEHAKLSASASERWLACTPSAQLERRFPNTSSVYAQEGTLAHTFGEYKLRNLFKKEVLDLEPLRQGELYSKEIDACSDFYVDYVRTVFNGYENEPHIAFEERLDMTDAVPEGFGTGDCVIVGDGRLDIIDYKHGKGVLVDAQGNSQLRLYAYGAYQKYSFLYDIKTVTMHIVQPRLDNVSSETLTATELLGWIEWVKKQAAKAAAGEGEFVPGDHCRFCRAKAVCRARSERYSALADFGFAKSPILSDSEIGKILTQGKQIEVWLSDLMDYAKQRVLDGGEIEGWKVVAGRSNRKFADLDKAFDTLEADGVDRDLLYERKPLALTAVEKLVGKRRFAELLGGQIIKPVGAPTLVQSSDKREPYSEVKRDFEILT